MSLSDFCSRLPENPNEVAYDEVLNDLKTKHDDNVRRVQECYWKKTAREGKTHTLKTSNLSSGAFGSVFKTFLFGQKYAVKIPLDIDAVQDLKDEYRNTQILNEFYQYIPNLVRSVAYFHCEVDFDKKGRSSLASGICPPHTTDRTFDEPNLVYEFIEGETVHDHVLNRLDTFDVFEFVDILLPLLLTIRFLQRVQFTHQDLHNNNVMLMPISQPVFVRYDEDTFVYDSFIPVMIDFGMATINGRGPNIPHLNLRPGTNPVHDFIRFTDSVLHILASYSARVSDERFMRFKPVINLLASYRPSPNYYFKYFAPNTSQSPKEFRNMFKNMHTTMEANPGYSGPSDIRDIDRLLVALAPFSSKFNQPQGDAIDWTAAVLSEREIIRRISP